jgi:hypothetical protein
MAIDSAVAAALLGRAPRRTTFRHEPLPCPQGSGTSLVSPPGLRGTAPEPRHYRPRRNAGSQRKRLLRRPASSGRSFPPPPSAGGTGRTGRQCGSPAAAAAVPLAAGAAIALLPRQSQRRSQPPGRGGRRAAWGFPRTATQRPGERAWKSRCRRPIRAISEPANAPGAPPPLSARPCSRAAGRGGGSWSRAAASTRWTAAADREPAVGRSFDRVYRHPLPIPVPASRTPPRPVTVLAELQFRHPANWQLGSELRD